MCRDKGRWFYPYDFMKTQLGELFVGYEAGARISELAKKYPTVITSLPDGKYFKRRLNYETIDEWFDLLDTDHKDVVAKELNYYARPLED